MLPLERVVFRDAYVKLSMYLLFFRTFSSEFECIRAFCTNTYVCFLMFELVFVTKSSLSSRMRFFLITHTSECACTCLVFWHIPRFLRAYISFTTTYTFENRRVPHVFTHRQRFISTCVVLNSRIHHISDVCVDIVLRCLFFCAYISCMTTCMFNSRRIPFVFRRIHRFISTFVENTLCWWIVMGVYVCKSRLCLC